MRQRITAFIFIIALVIGSATSHANCPITTGGTRVPGTVIYNVDYALYQYCAGTNWIGMSGGSNNPAGSSPTAPVGSGYFVLSNATYNGNLGDLTGANAKCLTDLTTNTGWTGYSTANSNGQLTSSKVFAFLCTSGGGGPCNNLVPLTRYNFANAGNNAAGGAFLRQTAAAPALGTTQPGPLQTTSPAPIHTGHIAGQRQRLLGVAGTKLVT